MNKPDYAENKLIKTIHKAVEDLANGFSALHETLSKATGKIGPFERYPLADALNKTMLHGRATPASEKSRLEIAFNKSLPIKAMNAERARNNALVRESLCTLISEAGGHIICDRKKPRSPSILLEIVKRKWFSEFISSMPVNDLWEDLNARYKMALVEIAIATWENRIKLEKLREAGHQERLAEQTRQARKFKIIGKKYGSYDNVLGTPYTSLSVLGVVIFGNKYLRLAHFMEANSNDWSDGYNIAIKGLKYFIPENDIDKQIKAEIAGIVYGLDDCDGRRFRDCTWNYERLFAMAEEQNPDLMADYRKLMDPRQ